MLKQFPAGDLTLIARCSLFAVEYMFIGIDYPDDGAIRWRFVTFERKARFLSATPKYKFADACPDSVQCHHWLSLFFQISIKRLNDKELTAGQCRVLDRGYDRAYYSSDLHQEVKSISSMTPMIAESTGQSLFPSAIRAEDPPTTITFS